MKRFLATGLITIIVLAFAVSQSVFFVDETQRAFVIQLGEPVGGVRTPGFNFKRPLVQHVVFFDNRIRRFDLPKSEVPSLDKKIIGINSYACWRIIDPLLFFKTLRADINATSRLQEIVLSQLSAGISSHTLKGVVDTDRKSIMESVLKSSNEHVAQYGVKIIDVRITRTELPNREAIFERMRADRTKLANQYRAEGESAKLDIRSQAERIRDVIISEARRQSTIIRGEADARAMEIMRRAIALAPEFYEFTKSMEVYKKSFQNNSKVILSTDEPLLKFFQ